MRPLDISGVRALRWLVMRKCVGFMFRVCVLPFDRTLRNPSFMDVPWRP